MITKDTILQIKEKILTSGPFKNRKLHQDLLAYLIDAHNNDIIPKEITIALDVFNKDNDFNSNEDTIVRVHMHKLRKMLQQYYETEGVSDNFILTIPKGHYKILITQRSGGHKKPGRMRIGYFKAAILLINLMALIYLFFILTGKKPGTGHGKSNSCIWQHFFNNNLPASLIVGDFYVFHEADDQLNRTRRIQDYEINTKTDFEKHKAAYPERYPEEWILGEVPHNIIFNLMDINRVFHDFDKELNIQFSTGIDIDFIKDRNIIYIGEFKNLRALTDLITALPFEYETRPWWHGSVTYTNGDSAITLETFHDWNISRYVIDLGVVAKIPGENNENYLFFIGFGYNSQIELVSAFCQNTIPEFLKTKILTGCDEFPEYFIGIYEIAGFDRASSKIDLKFFQEIDREIYRYYNPSVITKH